MMFEYFPTNYPWSMATLMAMNAGGIISEVDEVLCHLRDVASHNADEANREWQDAWSSLGERCRKLAKADMNLNHKINA